MNARPTPRARFAEVGEEHRAAVARMLVARKQLQPVDLAVFAFVVSHLAGWSRLVDALSVAEVVEAVGCSRFTAGRSLRRLHDAGVIGWQATRANRGTSTASRVGLSPVHVPAVGTCAAPRHEPTVSTSEEAPHETTAGTCGPEDVASHVPTVSTSHVLTAGTHTEEYRGEGEGDPLPPDDAETLTPEEAHEVNAAFAARRVAEGLGLADALTAEDRRALVSAMLAIPDDRHPDVVAGAVRRRPPLVVDSPAGLARARVRDACAALGLEVPA